MNKLDIMPKDISEITNGKKLKFGDVEGLLKETIELLKKKDKEALPYNTTMLMVFCQMLWNEKEALSDEFKELKGKFLELYDGSQKLCNVLNQIYGIVSKDKPSELRNQLMDAIETILGKEDEKDKT